MNLNIEIERQTQVFVDTVRDAIDERLGPLLPALQVFKEALLDAFAGRLGKRCRVARSR